MEAKKVSELDGIDLDYWVAQITGMLRMVSGSREFQLGGYSPSTKWEHGGPLIQQYKISVLQDNQKATEWSAQIGGFMSHDWVSGDIFEFGPTHLIAAMRALVASVYGETVPEGDTP